MTKTIERAQSVLRPVGRSEPAAAAAPTGQYPRIRLRRNRADPSEVAVQPIAVRQIPAERSGIALVGCRDRIICVVAAVVGADAPSIRVRKLRRWRKKKLTN